jgi:hypothetical protein
VHVADGRSDHESQDGQNTYELVIPLSADQTEAASMAASLTLLLTGEEPIGS